MENTDKVEDVKVGKAVDDNTIAVDANLLVNVLNLIHKDHSEVIDTYTQLFATIVKSGKVQK